MAAMAEHQRAQGADRPGPHHQHRRARRRGQPVDRVQRHRQRLRHRRHGGRHRLIGQPQDLPLGQDRHRREAAVIDLADEAHAGAQIALAGAAAGAGAARHPGIRHHPVPGRQRRDRGTDRLDRRHELVPGRRGGAGDPDAGAIVVQVGAADSCHLHPQADLVAGRRAGILDILDPQVSDGRTAGPPSCLPLPERPVAHRPQRVGVGVEPFVFRETLGHRRQQVVAGPGDISRPRCA